MTGTPCKAPFHCPHCGFIQHEPPQLVSTFCRSCGSHYAISHADTSVGKNRGRLIDRAAKRAISHPSRPVYCYQCEQTHEVSVHAKSTICTGCNTSIELGDLTFSSHVSRPVNTRGRLTIESGGCLNNASSICGEAVIEGKINGALLCEGTLRLAASGQSAGQFSAKSVIIEKEAQVELIHPVKTVDLLVNGRARGSFECAGSVRIAKRGLLEGRIVARSVIVEHGGILRAESSIQPVRVEDIQPEKRGEELDPFSSSGPLPAY